MKKALVDVACVCGCRDPTLVYNKGDFNIVKCRGCGLVYTNPCLKEEVLLQRYSNSELCHLNESIIYKRDYLKTFDLYWRLIGKFVKKGKILDIGCGSGYFLDVAKSKGMLSFGLDADDNAVLHCRKNNHDVKKCNTKLTLEKNSYDMISLIHSFEHLSDLKGSFKTFKDSLKDKGLLLVVTPNIGSFIAKLFGKNWIHLKPKSHLYFFSKKTLSDLFRGNGFDLVLSRSVGRYIRVSLLIEKLREINSTLSVLFKKIIPKYIQSKTIYVDMGDVMLMLGRKNGNS